MKALLLIILLHVIAWCYHRMNNAQNAIKELWIKMAERIYVKEIGISWNANTGVMDTEHPYYTCGENYDSPFDMESKRANAFEKLGEELKSLWIETLQYT